MRARSALAVLVVALGGCDVVFNLQEPPPPAPPPPERWDRVSGGKHHTCGIRLDRTLWCWGRNDYGQLTQRDNANDLELDEPRQVGTAADWVDVECGSRSTCAINGDGGLFCWGANDTGQIGDATNVDDEAHPVPYQLAGSWRAVSVAGYHGCAIAATGAMSCWGDNLQGQLGDQAMLPGPTIRAVSSSLTWKSVTVGVRFTCAIATDDSGWCWGVGNYGQLGRGSTLSSSVPTSLGTATWSKIVAGASFACGLQLDGHMRCWGQADSGQIGNGSTITAFVPAPVGQDEVADWTDVAAGEEHVCAQHASGEVSCWGDNELGQLVSDLSRQSRTTPTPIETPEDATWTKVSAGDFHTCLIDDQAQLWCAGFAGAGNLGTGEGTRRVPTAVDGTWRTVAPGTDNTCAVSSTNQLFCWGWKDNGLIGDGAVRHGRLPTMLAGAWSTVAVSQGHACGLTTAPSANASCWGRNLYGQLGTVATTDSTVPVATSGGLTFSSIAVSTGQHTCAVGSDQLVYCWGNNGAGQAGQDPGTVSQPRSIEAGGLYQFLDLGNAHSCGIRATGEVACWGYNGFFQLGDPAIVATKTPQNVVIPNSGAFDEIAAGEAHTCARAGTQVWCWGRNHHGQLATGSVSPADPERTLVAGSWHSIAAGADHTCGIRSDRTLACWGYNEWGQLGIASLFDRFEPTAVGTDDDWDRVFAGTSHTCALKQNGALSCWGKNITSQIGDGTAWRAQLVMVTK